MAINTLPSDLISFYKQNADLLIERSVVPDQRRYVIPDEGPRHYIDIDDYDHRDSIPKYWSRAVERYGEDFLLEHGHGPWYTYFTFIKLRNAFRDKEFEDIVRLSSDLAHYIADANVPLHTTSNYNGQLSNQHGIHGFWETRLPQLYSDNYDFFVGKAAYLEDPQAAIWQAVYLANDLVDSVFIVEQITSSVIGEENKFNYEQKGNRLERAYSKKFARKYHDLMPRVEQQMRYSIKMIGDFWFTAWIDAGQPELSGFSTNKVFDNSIKTEKRIIPARLHEY